MPPYTCDFKTTTFVFIFYFRSDLLDGAGEHDEGSNAPDAHVLQRNARGNPAATKTIFMRYHADAVVLCLGLFLSSLLK
jgi:hypothetical protein